MPVYYKESDARRDFIERKVNDDANITVDTSYFLTWLYADEVFDPQSFAAYENLMNDLMKEFPKTTHSEALSSITEVFVSREKVWVDGWSEYLANKPAKNLLQGDMEFNYDPSLPDC